MEGQGSKMLIIGESDGKLRLECEDCGAHAIRPRSILFWATRCQVCGAIGEIHRARERISDSRPSSREGVTARAASG
jgi:hypothetical protein